MGNCIARTFRTKKKKNQEVSLSQYNKVSSPLKRIYAATFNMGEGPVPSRQELRAWIPLDQDVYMIGVQECMVLDALRKELVAYFAQDCPTRKYLLYDREIGRTHTSLGYHGHIAILFFIDANDAQHPDVHIHTECKQPRVRLGKNLGISRAANKGGVGLSFQYYEHSIAVVSCHLASDSNGKSKFERRKEDASKLLRSLRLTAVDNGFDLQLCHHHTFILGDLNFRCSQNMTSPEKMLSSIKTIRCQQIVPALPTTPTAHSWENKVLPSWQNIVQSFKKLVHDHDELSYAMSRRELFVGFIEHPISHPPTFRRTRGVHFTQGMQPQEAYSISVRDTTRMPSYTDRILAHSLPDCSKNLNCISYTSCEAVVGSDHRPVCAQYTLSVLKLPREIHSYPSGTTTPVSVHIDITSCELWHTQEYDGFDSESSHTDSSTSSSTGQPESVHVLFQMQDVTSVLKAFAQYFKTREASASWTKAIAEGITYTAHVSPAALHHNMYLAIKMIGRAGQELGQCVLSIPTTHDVSVEKRYDLISGGQSVGQFTGKIQRRLKENVVVCKKKVTFECL